MVPKQQQSDYDPSENPENVISCQTRPLPKVQLAVLLYLQLAEPITAYILLPFLAQLISETGITGGDVTSIGYYTGLVESLFFLAEALTIFQWGRLSDRVGRRPILLTGLFGLAVSMIFFGLSHTFWGVVASRAIAGALNGNTGVIKCMMSEMTDETNIAKALGFMPIIWASGYTVASLLGGWLQHPYERLGGIFHQSLFWKDNPYFLPCIVSALYSASAFVMSYLLLRETAPIISSSNSKEAASVISPEIVPLPLDERSPLLSPLKKPPVFVRSLLTSRVLIVILNYCIFAICEIMFTILHPLFLSTPIAHGGLGMSPSSIGVCLAAQGIVNGIVSILLFERLNKRLGTGRLLRFCAISIIVIFPFYPMMNAIARAQQRLTIAVWIMFGMQLALEALVPVGFGCIFIYLTSAPPTRSALGTTNGLAQTTTSIMRTIGPAAATSLFALTMERGLLGGLLVYIVLCSFGIGAVFAAGLLPEKPWPRAEN